MRKRRHHHSVRARWNRVAREQGRAQIRRPGRLARVGKVVLLSAVAVLVVVRAAEEYSMAFANRYLLGPDAYDGCQITRVVDGDTVNLSCPISGRLRARVIAYDTPEIYSPKCVEEFVTGLRAKLYLQAMLLRATSISTKLKGKDRYGRSLITLIIDGEGAARRLVGAGLARWYDGGVRQGWCA